MDYFHFFSIFEMCLDAFLRGGVCFALRPESDVCDLRVVAAQLVPGGTLIIVLAESH